MPRITNTPTIAAWTRPDERAGAEETAAAIAFLSSGGLGWESNEQAWAASRAWVRRQGRPPTDLDFHSLGWLQYGYVQQGRLAAARALIDTARSVLAGHDLSSAIDARFAVGELTFMAAAASGAAGTPAIAAGDTPLQFMVIGDWGRDGAFHQREVAAAMGDFPASQFVVTTGDNFYQHGVSSVRDPKWDTSFNRIYTDVPQRWYPVLGNHDYGGSVEAQIERSFHDPRWRMPSYWFDLRLNAYGRPDVHLFFINTVAWRGREKFPYDWLGSSVRKRDSQNQREWLRDRLGRSDAPIKIVFGHHPIYSVRTRGSYYGMPDLDGLLFDHGVTAFVNGHDHCMYHISAPDWRGRAAGPGRSTETNRSGAAPWTAGTSGQGSTAARPEPAPTTSSHLCRAAWWWSGPRPATPSRPARK